MKKPAVLLADDDPNDVALVELAVKRSGMANPLFAVSNGLEVMQYLTGAGRFADRERYPLPRLLLLDLKMPVMDGFDILAWLKTRPEFKSIVRVVLTSSYLEVDVRRAILLGAQQFLTKPMSLPELTDLMRSLGSRWLGLTDPEAS